MAAEAASEITWHTSELENQVECCDCSQTLTTAMMKKENQNPSNDSWMRTSKLYNLVCRSPLHSVHSIGILEVIFISTAINQGNISLYIYIYSAHMFT